MPITDLTGYTWVGNISLGFLGDPDSQFNPYYLNFTCNNSNYTILNFEWKKGYENAIYYGINGNYTLLKSFDYRDMGWVDNSYKTIQITGGTDATNSTLIAYLEANGTLTPPAPSGHTLTIDGTDYTIDDNTNLLINSTGLYNSTTSTQVWTYSGDTKFLGFATSSGGAIVYDINDTITLTADLTLYSVEQARMPLYIDGERTDKYHGKVVNKIGDYFVARYEYSITTSVTNGTYSGATSILVNGTATVTITADSGYELPSITQSNVNGATLVSAVGGVLTLSNPTGDVTISVVCVTAMNFATDSWASIAANIKSGNDTYQLGDTKTDTITIGGTNYTVTFKIVDDLVGRYVTQSGSSHKVIEMQTVIGPNASSGVAWNSSGSASSFNASDLKSWLNNTAIGYLPSALQSVLETTTVYSGPGSGTTTDANKVSATGKLFSPCFNEYYGASVTYNWANNYETNSKGQFTYYYNQGVTTSNYSALIKQNLTGSNYSYWLRSPYDGGGAVIVRKGGSRYLNYCGGDDFRVCVCFAW